jgi:hypothetical protein
MIPSSKRLDAGVAQLVEHFLAKEDVASSSLVTRSTSPRADLQANRQRNLGWLAGLSHVPGLTPAPTRA